MEPGPVVRLVVLPGAGWVGDLVLFLVVLLSEVLQYAAGFEEADSLAIGESVCDGGDATVRVDFEEPGFFLFVG